jgi:FixJ family two-component response regulator
MSESVPQIYVVDDDVSVREAVGGLIRSAGLRVRTFASAQEMLASLRMELPSCLVLDIQLPDINGFELQQELATKDIQIPIIFLTGHGDIPMSVRAIKAGVLAGGHSQRDRARQQKRAVSRKNRQRVF